MTASITTLGKTQSDSQSQHSTFNIIAFVKMTIHMTATSITTFGITIKNVRAKHYDSYPNDT
jgi:hypothetical protein